MIYKLQRLYADNNNGKNNQQQDNQKKKNQQQGQQKGQGQPQQQTQQPQTPPEQPKPERPTKKYKTPGEARKAVEKERLEELSNLGGNTSYRNNLGERRTLENINKEFDTKIQGINAWEREQNKQNRKAKYNKAKGKVVGWAKRNKKGLIIGGSVLAAGTGATIVGSRIYKKNKQDKIKENVRGYSDVED